MRHGTHFHSYRPFQSFCNLKNEAGAIIPEILFASKDVAPVDSIKNRCRQTCIYSQFLRYVRQFQQKEPIPDQGRISRTISRRDMLFLRPDGLIQMFRTSPPASCKFIWRSLVTSLNPIISLPYSPLKDCSLQKSVVVDMPLVAHLRQSRYPLTERGSASVNVPKKARSRADRSDIILNSCQ